MSPLQAAAAALLPEAGDHVVRLVLKLLVDDVLPGALPARPPLALANGKRARRRAAVPKRARGSHPEGLDPDWEALRGQVRAAMTRQGIDITELAAALDVAASSVRVALYRRATPSRPLAAKLKAAQRVRAAWRSLRASNRYVLKLPAGAVQRGPHGPRRRTAGKSCRGDIQPTEPEASEGRAGALAGLLAGTVRRLTVPFRPPIAGVAPRTAATHGVASVSNGQGAPDSALAAAWARLGAAIAAVSATHAAEQSAAARTPQQTVPFRRQGRRYSGSGA